MIIKSLSQSLLHARNILDTMQSYLQTYRTRYDLQNDVDSFWIKVHQAGEIPWMAKNPSSWEKIEAHEEEMSTVFINIQGEKVTNSVKRTLKKVVPFYSIYIFQDSFRKISKNLRDCRFPDEGNSDLFVHYTKSNCELECAWNKAEEHCGCRPWYIPSLDSAKTCFVLGNLCFDHIMKKIEKKKISTDCECFDDCSYNQYSISQQENIIFERSAPRVFEYSFNGHVGDAQFGHFGTNAMDGLDFDETYWFNMGK